MKKQRGFSLLELIFALGIIALLTTLATVALRGSRTQTRDAARIHDIQQIRSTLELYYDRYRSYPTMITPGQTFAVNGQTYLDPIPSNPSPRNDNGCGNNDYTYAATSDNKDYSLNFCLGGATGASTSGGINSASSSGLGTAPGLVGWWKFDEATGNKAYDSSSYKNDVTLYGSTPYYGAGKSNLYAGEFNGSNNYGDTSGFNVQLYGTHSLSLWVKIRAYSTYGAIVLYSADSTSVQSFYQIYNNTAYAGKPSGYMSFNLTSYHNDNTWRHYVFVLDGVNSQAKLYVNGNQMGATVAYNAKINDNLKKIYIGKYTSALWNLNGYIDDLRIYNRALSATEISALYNAGAN